MPYSQVSKKSGKVYYLHIVKALNGGTLYNFKLTIGPNSMEQLPNGYMPVEIKNGTFRLKRIDIKKT